MELTQDDVLQILKLVEASDVDYLEVQLGETRLVASKSGVLPASAPAPAAPAPAAAPAPVSGPAAVPAAPQGAAAAAPAAPQAAVAATAPAAAEETEEGLATVTAPVVGVFYVAPEPGAPPFVEVGSRVEQGATMGLVEVMKMFNSVTAEVAGEVVRALATNEQFVEYGQPLFLVLSGARLSIARVFVANRGEIAVRIIRACRALGMESVVGVSEADRDSMAATLADRAVCIGPPRATVSYLNTAAILAAALGTGCDAVHPGYGFLAENADFGAACEAAGLVFVGPRPETVRTMGNKLAAREIAQQAGVPVVPGSASVATFTDAATVVEDIGYPVLLKAAAGGGGRGIRIVHRPEELPNTFSSAAAEADAAFGDGTLYVERYIGDGRHIEVQVFGDQQGNVVHFGERDCSLQRRYQKIVEEAPASLVPAALRDDIVGAAVALAEGIGYTNAGTVEFIYDQQRREFHFLEMNTRIQVEHPVTEEITGVDLVQLQLRVASGQPLGIQQSDVRFEGHAIECRITAELPSAGFRPSPGLITRWDAPEGSGIRLDTHCYAGYRVPPFYDSLLAKLITSGADRDEAIARMQDALGRFVVEGVDTGIDFLAGLMAHSDYRRGEVNTRWVEEQSGALQAV